MKKSEELKAELVLLEKEKNAMAKRMVWENRSEIEDEEEFEKRWDKYWLTYGKEATERISLLRHQIDVEECREVEVGDGVTLCLYTDAHAYTVLKKTAKTILIQRDRAILDPSFKPEFVPGGFAAHCVNQEEQRYTYERDPNGETVRCYWSEKLGRYTTGGDQSIKIRPGRHEFYDYNF